jgi:hypothetical protein
VAKQRAVAAADVDDRLVAAPLESGQSLEAPLLALLHRAVEPSSLVGMLSEPGPELAAEQAWKCWFAGGIESLRSPIPDAAEEAREVVPTATAAQVLGGRCVAEDAGSVLCKDAVARERAQQPVERVGVGVCLPCQVGDRPRPVGETVSDAELRDDGQCAGSERAAE